jgi:plasmid stabilization system protein ParE
VEIETMPGGDKSKYTEKQKRQAEHIEESYEERGVAEEEAERRAWAIVNEMTGGKKPVLGRDAVNPSIKPRRRKAVEDLVAFYRAGRGALLHKSDK